MEDREVVCSAEGCGCKAICYRVKGDEKEPLCIWHCYTQSDEYPLLFSKVHYVDIYAITEEDIRFIKKAQEVFQQVFAQKERSEKDLLNREVYKLISLYFSKTFNALLKISRKWRNILMKWKKGISNLLSNRNEKFLNSEVIKEKLERLKDIYFSFKLVSRYLDSKTLFDLLSVCNDNIGILSFGKDLRATEETKEDTCSSIGTDVRSGIFESYYLIEGAYYMKKPFQSFNLSKDIISTINSLKDLDKPSSKFKVKVKEPDANEKLFASNTLNLNNDLSNISSIQYDDKVCQIGCTFKTLNSDEQKEIIGSYSRYLTIKSTSILNFNLREIKICQLKDNLFFKNNSPDDPITNINFGNNCCQHDGKGNKKSFYYLPELGINLGFMHKFHKAYFFCSEYVPLLKFDSRDPLEILYRIQSLALDEKSFKEYNRLDLELEGPII